MKRLLMLAALLLPLAFACHAQEPQNPEPGDRDVPWKANEEIARLGNFVQRIDGFQAAEDDPLAAIGDALQPPPDDSHKWYITVITTRNCAACERLKADFENSPALAPWANTRDYKRSWSHYNVVDIADQTQAWRWKNFKPTSFPTVIVQPPYNGSWGDPHTVVYLKSGYDGKPEQLDAAFRDAITRYAAKVFPRHLAWEQRTGVSPGFADDGGYKQAWQSEGHGQQPPFSPLPPNPSQPVQPWPYQPTPQPGYQIPPPQPAPPAPPAVQPTNPFPTGNSLLSWALVFLLTTNAGIGLLQVGLKFLEGRAAATPSKIDDNIVAALRRLLDSQTKPVNPAQS